MLNWIEELKKLGELHRSGILSDDEFNTAKRKLLSQKGRCGWRACRCGVCVLCRFMSSPQPALVRVAARGQPSGHLASGGVADAAEEAARAVAEEVERTVERGV